MMQLAKKVPFEDPQVLMLVRGCYILSNVLILAIHLWTQLKINQKKGMSRAHPTNVNHLLIII
jgi:hypothetical protein